MRTTNPQGYGWASGLGCLVPPLCAGIGLAVGWWSVSYAVGIGLAVVAAIVALRAVARYTHGNTAFEIGCILTVLGLAAVIAIVPAIERIKTRVEQTRAERSSPEQMEK